MARKKGLPRFLVLLTLIFLILPQISSAKGVRRLPLDTTSHYLKTSVLQAPEAVVEDFTKTETTESTSQTGEITPPKTDPEESVSCQFNMPQNKEYSAKFVAVRKKGVVAKGEILETTVYIKNTGNTPWFSSDSGCPYLITNLGTDNERDRNSIFYTNDLLWNSEWAGPNRISMETKRVDPGELGVFRYWSRAPQQDGYFREFFTPVIEGVKWLEGSTFYTDTKVGDAFLDVEKKDLLKYVEESTDLTKVDLNGAKSINISISQQKMWLKIGDIVIREFPVSTGTTRTPTPLGTTQILSKQEVRVAGSWPHYIMPKWMTYRAGGYGIHALPSLANDNGVFWREALNHIGTRRSHGCVRLLPQDAEFAYNFTEVGTPVHVFW